MRATSSPRRCGFEVCCPSCFEEDSVHVHLSDLAGDQAFECRECGQAFGLDDLHRLFESWKPFLAFFDAVKDRINK